MQTLKKTDHASNPFFFGHYQTLLWVRGATTRSPKPYARLMRSLYALIRGDNAPLQAPRRGFSFAPVPPNRAARRANLQPYFPNAAQRRKLARDMKFGRPSDEVSAHISTFAQASPRKLTGAVRRGLERGKSA